MQDTSATVRVADSTFNGSQAEVLGDTLYASSGVLSLWNSTLVLEGVYRPGVAFTTLPERLLGEHVLHNLVQHREHPAVPQRKRRVRERRRRLRRGEVAREVLHHSDIST